MFRAHQLTSLPRHSGSPVLTQHVLSQQHSIILRDYAKRHGDYTSLTQGSTFKPVRLSYVQRAPYTQVTRPVSAPKTQPHAMATRNTNPVVLITGCSKGGIGYHLCTEFAKAGCQLYASSRNVSTMEGLQQHGCKMLALDVTSSSSIKEAVAKVCMTTFACAGVDTLRDHP